MKENNGALISIMAASNEIGTVQPLKEIGGIASENSAVFHCDAVQALGKVPLDVKKNNIGLMSLSSHKISGPKGVGALYVKRDLELVPRMFGGAQERGLRSGTQNVPAVLGFVKAAEIACENVQSSSQHLFSLTEYMYSRICSSISGVLRNGHPEKRLPGTLNISIPGVETQIMVASLDQEGFCISGGSACQSGALDPLFGSSGHRPQVSGGCLQCPHLSGPLQYPRGSGYVCSGSQKDLGQNKRRVVITSTSGRADQEIEVVFVYRAIQLTSIFLFPAGHICLPNTGSRFRGDNCLHRASGGYFP